VRIAGPIGEIDGSKQANSHCLERSQYRRIESFHSPDPDELKPAPSLFARPSSERKSLRRQAPLPYPPCAWWNRTARPARRR
jgi:hypothetical protein